MLIMARCRHEIRTHLATTIELLCALGFIINMKKSVFTPARTIEFLGFIVDSTAMTIRLPQQKLAALRKMANQLLRQEKVTAGPAPGYDGSSTPCNPPSPTPLQSIRESEAESCSRPSWLRVRGETAWTMGWCRTWSAGSTQLPTSMGDIFRSPNGT
jgi:hypothetical protein